LGTFNNKNTPFGIFTRNEKRGCPFFYSSYGTLKKDVPYPYH